MSTLVTNTITGLSTAANITIGSTPVVSASANSLTIRGEGSAQTSIQQGLCKAWITWETSGTASVLDSFNMTSITDNATGDTSLTIANNFSNINHTFAGNVGTSNRRFLNIIDTPTVTIQRVKCLDVDDAGQDENFQYGQMVGDLA